MVRCTEILPIRQILVITAYTLLIAKHICTMWVSMAPSSRLTIVKAFYNGCKARLKAVPSIFKTAFIGTACALVAPRSSLILGNLFKDGVIAMSFLTNHTVYLQI